MKPQSPDLVAKSIAPDYALGTHVPPLGLAHSRCRPVGVALDKQGALLVVDDVGNVIWRVTSAKSSRP